MNRFKKLFRWVLLPLFVIITAGGFIGYKMYTKPHRSVFEEKAVKISSNQLARDYQNDEQDANHKYLDKVLEVHGIINEISTNQKGELVINLEGTDMSSLICTLEGAQKSRIDKGSEITLKGICTGFLTDVVLIRCIVYNK